MGMEYKLKFVYDDEAQVDIFLSSLPCFAKLEKGRHVYIYREGSNTGEMPNAEIKIEREGLYLCDYGMSKHLFGFWITKFISQFGSICIEEYE